MKLQAKMVIFGIIMFIIPTSIISYYSYNTAKKGFDEYGQVILENAVEEVIMMIDSQKQSVENGKITLEEAQESVKVQLLGAKDEKGIRPINGSLKLGESGYVWAFSETGDMLMHPSMEGMNVWDVEDKSGTGYHHVQEMYKVAIKGGGFIDYSWTLPNSEKIAEKVSYQAYDEDWGWIISAGAYKFEFNNPAKNMLNNMIFILMITGTSAMIGIYLFSKFTIKNLKIVDQSLNMIAHGQLNISKIENKGNDETRSLSDSFNTMLLNLRNMISHSSLTSNSVYEATNRLSQVTTESTKGLQEVTTTIEGVAKAVLEEAQSAEKVVSK